MRIVIVPDIDVLSSRPPEDFRMRIRIIFVLRLVVIVVLVFAIFAVLVQRMMCEVVGGVRGSAVEVLLGEAGGKRLGQEAAAVGMVPALGIVSEVVC